MNSSIGRRLSPLVALVFALALGGNVFGQVVINEILQNPAAVADSAGEWFEVFNPTGSAVDINGWTILDNDIDSHVIANGGPLLVPAGGFLVLGNNGNFATNGGVNVDYVFSGVFLANGADELVLQDAALNEIDRVEWDDGVTFPDPNGASMSLISPALNNNVGGNWCTASTPFGAGDLGTPGAANDCPMPEVVINEILQNPAAVADSAGEWFEVFNPGAAPVDINGWTILDNDFDSHVINNGGPLLVPSGGFLVLGNNQNFATNGGVNVAYQYSGIALANGADELVLLDNAMTEIDRVEWDDGVTFPDPNGASMSLFSAALDNNVGANWCTASTPFGAGDLGTPGAPNDCAVAELVINEIMQNPAAVSDGAGEWFEVYNPTGSAIDMDGWTILDNDFDSHVISNGGPLLVPAGGFLVLGNNSDFSTNGGVNVGYQYSGVFLANGADELVLLDGSMIEIDRVEWDGGPNFPDPNGASMSLILPTLDNNVGSNWCEAATPFGAGDRGTPGAANDCPFGPQLVINEIDYDQPGADFAEFIEIFNSGPDPEDLSGVTLELINGFDNSVYGSFPLPAVVLNPGAHFVVCSNAATVANCDLDVLSSIQNGSPDAVALVFGGVIIDFVEYEGAGGGPADSNSAGEDNKGIARFPNGADTDSISADFAFVCITPGGPNTSLDANCTPTGPVLEIYEIQGDSIVSPFAGQTIRTIDNVVTAVGTDGFAMQTPTAATDGDVNTSDGIFVFTGGAPAVAVGDLVDVVGTVQEFFNLTEYSLPDVTVTGSGAVPAPVAFDAAVPSPDPTAPSCSLEFECYEGMLVAIADGTVTGPNQRFGTDPIAEVHITAAPARTFREKGIQFPGIMGLPVWDGNPEVFELDPDRLGLPNQIIPAGSSFSATGVIGFEFGGYELWPTQLAFTPAPLPVPVRPRNPGEFTVGSLNLFRLFSDVGGAEYARRLEKFSRYIREVLDSPDVLAVQEAQNIGVLDDLAARIAMDDASVNYTGYLIEGNDVGGIDVGFLVRDTVQVNAVTQLAATEILTFDGTLLHDRPPLLLDADYIGNGAPFAIAVMAVHNRSLNGIDDPMDGARVRQKRFEQAQSIATLIQDIQTADPAVRLAVTGDFNAFEFTDGYVDAVGQIRGVFDQAENFLFGDDLVFPDLSNQVLNLPASQRYSFIFAGSAQTLDHMLTTVEMDFWVRDFAFGRGNADAAVDLINDASTALRSTDHDGLVLYVMSDEDADGIPDDQDLCAGTSIPEGVPTEALGVNRWALVDGDGIFDTALPPGGGEGPGLSFTIEDTRGCSCEQIIEDLGLGEGHRKFGCSNSAMLDWVALVNP